MNAHDDQTTGPALPPGMPSRAERTRARLAAQSSESSQQQAAPDAAEGRPVQPASVVSAAPPSLPTRAQRRRATAADESTAGSAAVDPAVALGPVAGAVSGAASGFMPRLREPRMLAEEAEPTSFVTRHLSPLVVALFCAVLALGGVLLDFQIAAVFVVSAVCVVLAVGWEDATRIPIPLSERVVIALCGLVALNVVVQADDLAPGMRTLGVSIMVLGAVHIFTRHPRADAALMSFATAAVGCLVSVSGAAVLAIAIHPSWSDLLVPGALILLLIVVADQLGRSWKMNSLWAMVAGVVGGVVIGLTLHYTGVASSIAATVLPELAGRIGLVGAVAVFSALVGLTMALAVSAVDGLIGDYELPASLLGAASRGAAKFLVAALPLYAMIRVGGV